MKRLLILIAVLLIACKEEPKVNYAIISGKIINKVNGEVSINSYDRTFTENLNMSEDGSFVDTLKIDIPYSKSAILDMAPIGYENLKNTFPKLEYQPASVKKSLFSYPLTYMGFSGYLNPFSNEAQVDAMIPVYLFPTTTLHEMAHQVGYAAENEANFIGCLAAINHNDIYFKYSGYTFALRFCLNEIAKRDEALFEKLCLTINKGILKNFKEARDFWDSYENPLEPLFKKTYSSYLKANSQAKGMESYSYVVALLVNYFEKTNF